MDVLEEVLPSRLDTLAVNFEVIKSGLDVGGGLLKHFLSKVGVGDSLSQGVDDGFEINDFVSVGVNQVLDSVINVVEGFLTVGIGLSLE